MDIDVDNLIENCKKIKDEDQNINPLSAYLYLQLLYENRLEKAKTYVREFLSDSSILQLQKLSFLKKTNTGNIIRFRTLSLFNHRISIEPVADWIQVYRDLFPPRYKGDKLSCMKKMTRFMKDRPRVTKEEVLKATEAYIKEQSMINNYKYLRQPEYFIDKNGISPLGAYLEKTDEEPPPDLYYGSQLV